MTTKIKSSLGLMVLISILAVLNCIAQVPENFIGKTPAQVRSYLETKISAADWEETVDDKTGEIWFYVMTESVGSPDFNWFFKNDKCYQHSFKVTIKEAPIYRARFKQSKLIYDAANERWIDKLKNTFWKVDGEYVSAEKLK